MKSGTLHERLRGGIAPVCSTPPWEPSSNGAVCAVRCLSGAPGRCVDSPSTVLAIHRDDLEAGADILTANTFRTHGRSLEKAGKGMRAEELTRQAVTLARRAAGESPRPILVAGSLSPLEDCYRPDLVPDEGTLWQEHGRQATLLAAAGADLILAETHNSVRELAAAVRAAKATGLPVIASMVTDGQGRLLSGEPIAAAARALEGLRPDVLSINCVRVPTPSSPTCAPSRRRLRARRWRLMETSALRPVRRRPSSPTTSRRRTTRRSRATGSPSVRASWVAAAERRRRTPRRCVG